ncbi:MAG TPA: hypothetical protein VER97_09030 [Geodermatophilus sp.]|nr:hypothetical protein [Geodermatophilus sp.]
MGERAAASAAWDGDPVRVALVARLTAEDVDLVARAPAAAGGRFGVVLDRRLLGAPPSTPGRRRGLRCRRR